MKVVVERKTGMDFQFESFSHAKTHLRYHLVFTTKYRRSALAGIEDRVYRAFREVEDVSEFTILEMGCDLGNHIHLLVTLRPALSIEQVVRRLKQMSTRKLWEMEPDHLSRFYWGPKRGKLWSTGYFCATVGHTDDDTITGYILRQAK
mgnify:CR=1 FL=1